ncbi:MAG: AGE family epimerase/isomerase [Burkholderiales bacterium]|nr:AGE family epimerase/isomerase [Burkholderiales bacterium]
MKQLPDFRSAAFLREHLLQTMAFYDGPDGHRAVDPSGGLYHFLLDDGRVSDRHTRHLVSSTRYVFTYANAARHFPDHPHASRWRATARHALAFVQDVHRDPPSGGYTWLLHWESGRKQVMDTTQHCYGLAFVLLAQAHAVMAGLDEARSGLRDTLALMEQRFWEPAAGLYADEAAPDWQLRPYRGQNANMHACEAMLAAYEATGDAACLARATTLAESVTQRLASQAHGLVWEHYRADWTPDWNYNRQDRSNIFRPWGFQTGHLTEWAKLLLTLERLTPGLPPDTDEETWMLRRARELFAAAVQHGWDRAHGGLVYGFAPERDPATDTHHKVCDGDKYHWVQAESLAAAAALAERTHEGAYWDWYDRLWAYAWEHFVDHTHGAWFRILTPDNRKLTDQKSPAGKVDYHNMGACYEVLAALERLYGSVEAA